MLRIGEKTGGQATIEPEDAATGGRRGGTEAERKTRCQKPRKKSRDKGEETAEENRR